MTKICLHLARIWSHCISVVTLFKKSLIFSQLFIWEAKKTRSIKLNRASAHNQEKNVTVTSLTVYFILRIFLWERKIFCFDFIIFSERGGLELKLMLLDNKFILISSQKMWKKSFQHISWPFLIFIDTSLTAAAKNFSCIN